ncbi:MAG: hypothetical protein WAN46_21085, partial [Gammaproteobacteria bacterium]
MKPKPRGVTLLVHNYVAIALRADAAPEPLCEELRERHARDVLDDRLADEGVDGVILEHRVTRLLALHALQDVNRCFVELLRVLEETDAHGPLVPAPSGIGAGIRHLVLGRIEPGGHVGCLFDGDRVPLGACQLGHVLSDRLRNVDLAERLVSAIRQVLETLQGIAHRIPRLNAPVGVEMAVHRYK